MLEILEQGDERLIGLRITGSLSEPDLKIALARLEDVIEAAGGPIRLLVHIRELGGITPGALWEDLKFSLQHLRDFERMAVVADQTWIAWWTRLGGALSPAEVRQFEQQELEQAWAWLKAP